MDPLYIAIVIWTVCAILAAIVANVRHTNPLSAFFLGLILGPLGILLVAVQKPAEPVKWN